MSRRTERVNAFLVAVSLLFAAASPAGAQAAAPPMGWSEWDAYGITVTEADFRANAAVLASLKQYGWQYALFDAGWYMQNPGAADKAGKRYVVDDAGRLTPAVNRFPSAANGAGFKPLADWLHARGLKLGIHVMPGIPRQAVEANRPIAGSPFHAAEAADTTQTCSWDSEFYVARENTAGQAYLDSIFKLYAQWGVDYIKLGCVSDHPAHPGEIRQIAEAIAKAGRPMVFSLSPGPPSPEVLEIAQRSATAWRFSEEHWDFWTPEAGQTGHMVGLRQDFDLFEKWASAATTGHWIDGDVLPAGWLGPHPAWGEARATRLTHDERRSEFALWAFARSPLFMGANLTQLDAFTRALMTNREILAINQTAQESHPVRELPASFENLRVWEAQTQAGGRARSYLAFFNIEDKPVVLHATWAQFGVKGAHSARSLWDGKRTKAAPTLEATIAAHGCAVYEVE